MNKNPKVTVGIPVYNGERYIKQSVMSVLNQTYRDFELIVTDDGSKDSTLSVLESINDPRLIIVSDGANHGIAYRLNQQIELAKGEIFVRMDADDIMMPNRLKREIEELNSKQNVDVLGAQVVVIGENDELLGIRGRSRDIKWKDNHYFTKARFIHPTVAGRTEWFKKWRYNNKLSGNEDLDLWIRSHKESVFYTINEPLLFYRDPYKFRLGVFLFRQKRYTKCAWQLRHHMSTPWFFVFCICRTMVSTVMALFLTLIGQEQKMISKRNSPLTEAEKIKYSEIIKNISI